MCIIAGMQSWTVKGSEPYGLPLKHKILPQFLNDLGYKSVAVGKWHLGEFLFSIWWELLLWLPISTYFDKVRKVIFKIFVSGSFSANYTPVYRGFASHVGHWLGKPSLCIWFLIRISYMYLV